MARRGRHGRAFGLVLVLPGLECGGQITALALQEVSVARGTVIADRVSELRDVFHTAVDIASAEAFVPAGKSPQCKPL
jgi:hypothetical protein